MRAVAARFIGILTIVCLFGGVWQLSAFAAFDDGGVDDVERHNGIAVVQMIEEPVVLGPDILLGDIAVIRTGDEKIARALQELVIGRAPLPGQQRVVQVATVRTRMRQQRLPVREIAIVAEKPEIVVHTAGNDVPGAVLMAAAQEAIAARAKQMPYGSDVDTRWLIDCALPDDATVAAGPLNVRVQRLSGSWPGSVIAAVEIVVGGTVERTVMVRCQTELEQDVLVASVNLQRHDVLYPETFVVERRMFSSMPRETLLSAQEADDLARWRTTRPVRSGTVLTVAMVEPVPVIEKGRSISIVASLDGIVVVAPAVALEDGGLGDVIRVENELSGQVVRGVVVADDKVQALLH